MLILSKHTPALSVVVQFVKISHFVRDDTTATLFVISSDCERSVSIGVLQPGVKLHHDRSV